MMNTDLHQNIGPWRKKNWFPIVYLMSAGGEKPDLPAALCAIKILKWETLQILVKCYHDLAERDRRPGFFKLVWRKNFTQMSEGIKW